MKERWHYEMALQALALLQRQQELVGGLGSPGGGPETLKGSAELERVIEHWASFFEEAAK